MALFLVLILPCLALAHPIDLGTLDIHRKASALELSLDMPVPVAAELSGMPVARFRELGASLVDVFGAVSFGDGPTQITDCPWRDARAEIIEDRLIYRTHAACVQAPEAWRLDLDFLRRAPRNFELVTKVSSPPAPDFSLNLNSEDHLVEFPPRANHAWFEFVRLGILHIGVGPSEWRGPAGFHLPDGIDHILFVVGLMLCSGELFGLLKTVTGFTLGHSVTLALASFGLIQLPGTYVEAAIALSIAIVAAERLFLRRAHRPWIVATLFGLIHGMGFATALRELNLSPMELVRALIGFNVGVELGQLTIILCTFPLIIWLDRRAWGRKYVTSAIAGIISICGLFWFVRRIGF